MFSPAIIAKLQTARREAFKRYDEIVLDAGAVRVFARLFVNPDCQTDIDIFKLTDPEVRLSLLGDHIITAGPSTVAKFAHKHNRTKIRAADLLTCFALDHAHDVHDNKIPEKKNAFYALAHILTIGRVTSVKKIGHSKTVHLETPTPWGSVVFRHVVVPRDMTLKLNQYAYQHFGVAVAAADDAQLAQRLFSLQHTDDFIAQLGRDAAQKKIVIDYADPALFHMNVLTQILKPHRVRKVKNPGDLKHGKIKFKK